MFLCLALIWAKTFVASLALTRLVRWFCAGE
jgi:hypothetical protein